MPRPLLSRRTLIELREYLVGNYVVRTIEELFNTEGIPCDTDYDPGESSVRRTLVEQYYHSLNLTAKEDVDKLFRAFAAVLFEIEVANTPEQLQKNLSFQAIVKRLEMDRYLYGNGKIIPKEQGRLATPTTGSVTAVTSNCFTIMPFTDIFDSYYREIISPTVKLAGFDPIRADDVLRSGTIIR
jgi:hypothetical protein